MGWFKGLSIGARLITIAVVLGLLVVIGVGVQRYLTLGAKTENKLNKGLGGAAMESGGDAVNTVSNRASTEAGDLGNVQETRHEIDKQTDAGGVTRAGRSGLCDRPANRGRAGCVQRPPSE